MTQNHETTPAINPTGYSRETFQALSEDEQKQVLERFASGGLSRKQIAIMTGQNASNTNLLLSRFRITTKGKAGRPHGRSETGDESPISLFHFRVGQKIERYMVESNLSRKNLASAIDTTGIVLGRVLIGAEDAKLSLYGAIADYFEIRLCDLFDVPEE